MRELLEASGELFEVMDFQLILDLYSRRDAQQPLISPMWNQALAPPRL